MNKPIKILYFSRGRGHGHAIADMLLQKQMAALGLEASIQFASYATGLQTFAAAGVNAFDLKLPENNGFLPTLLKAQALIAEVKPDVVISREEFAVFPAASICDVPSVFVSNWLPQPNTVFGSTLDYSSAIVIIEHPGIFPVSPFWPTATYTGPYVRTPEFTVKDRTEIRRELGIPEDATYIVAASGGWANEERAPVVDLLLSSFFQLTQKSKRLTIIAGGDFELVSLKAQGMSGVEVIRRAESLDRLMAAADVVLTKGTYGITYDAVAVGVPTIALSRGAKPDG